MEALTNVQICDLIVINWFSVIFYLFESSSLRKKRHNRVKTWSKRVDLFSKDFIVVPINERYLELYKKATINIYLIFFILIYLFISKTIKVLHIITKEKNTLFSKLIIWNGVMILYEYRFFLHVWCIQIY